MSASARAGPARSTSEPGAAPTATVRSAGRIEWGFRPDLLAGHLPGWLDHFRWLAAMLVTASHTRNALMADAAAGLNPAEQAFYFITLFATQSVVVFFVLSGLLVGGTILRRQRAGSFDAGDYAIDRASRLYVVLVPAVLFSWAMQWAGQTVTCPAPDRAATVLGNLAFLQNFRVVEPLCNNTPLWSLSSEGFFYLLAPLLVIAAARRSPLACGLCAVLILASLLSFVPDRRWTGFGLLLWCAGLLPWFLRLRVSPWLAAVPLVAVLLLGRLHVFDGVASEAVLAGLFALFLCSDLAAKPAPWPRLAAGLAAFSYSLYLVHMPIAQAVARWTGFQGLAGGEARSYLIYAAVLAAMVAAGWLFGRLFEARTAAVRRWLRGAGRAGKPAARAP